MTPEIRKVSAPLAIPARPASVAPAVGVPAAPGGGAPAAGDARVAGVVEPDAPARPADWTIAQRAWPRDAQESAAFTTKLRAGDPVARDAALRILAHGDRRSVEAVVIATRGLELEGFKHAKAVASERIPGLIDGPHLELPPPTLEELIAPGLPDHADMGLVQTLCDAADDGDPVARAALVRLAGLVGAGTPAAIALERSMTRWAGSIATRDLVRLVRLGWIDVVRAAIAQQGQALAPQDAAQREALVQALREIAHGPQPPRGIGPLIAEMEGGASADMLAYGKLLTKREPDIVQALDAPERVERTAAARELIARGYGPAHGAAWDRIRAVVQASGDLELVRAFNRADRARALPIGGGPPAAAPKRTPAEETASLLDLGTAKEVRVLLDQLARQPGKLTEADVRSLVGVIARFRPNDVAAAARDLLAVLGCKAPADQEVNRLARVALAGLMVNDADFAAFVGLSLNKLPRGSVRGLETLAPFLTGDPAWGAEARAKLAGPLERDEPAAIAALWAHPGPAGLARDPATLKLVTEAARKGSTGALDMLAAACDMTPAPDPAVLEAMASMGERWRPSDVETLLAAGAGELVAQCLQARSTPFSPEEQARIRDAIRYRLAESAELRAAAPALVAALAKGATAADVALLDGWGARTAVVAVLGPGHVLAAREAAAAALIQHGAVAGSPEWPQIAALAEATADVALRKRYLQAAYGVPAEALQGDVPAPQVEQAAGGGRRVTWAIAVGGEGGQPLLAMAIAEVRGPGDARTLERRQVREDAGQRWEKVELETSARAVPGGPLIRREACQTTVREKGDRHKEWVETTLSVRGPVGKDGQPQPHEYARTVTTSELEEPALDLAGVSWLGQNNFQQLVDRLAQHGPVTGRRVTREVQGLDKQVHASTTHVMRNAVGQELVLPESHAGLASAEFRQPNAETGEIDSQTFYQGVPDTIVRRSRRDADGWVVSTTHGHFDKLRGSDGLAPGYEAETRVKVAADERELAQVLGAEGGGQAALVLASPAFEAFRTRAAGRPITLSVERVVTGTPPVACERVVASCDAMRLAVEFGRGTLPKVTLVGDVLSAAPPGVTGVADRAEEARVEGAMDQVQSQLERALDKAESAPKDLGLGAKGIERAERAARVLKGVTIGFDAVRGLYDVYDGEVQAGLVRLAEMGLVLSAEALFAGTAWAGPAAWAVTGVIVGVERLATYREDTSIAPFALTAP